MYKAVVLARGLGTRMRREDGRAALNPRQEEVAATGVKALIPLERPFLDYVLSVSAGNVRYSALQSEEGGRFYHEQNCNMIIEADEQFPVQVPENYIWMTLNQLNTFIRFNNYVNVQARSLLSTIGFI